MSEPIRQPIFIVGTGRSGSTLFVRILARHPEVAWLSALAREFPGSPGLNALLMRALAWRPFEATLGAWARPSEAYPLWELSSPGFSNPCRDLVAGDVTPEGARRLRDAFARMTNAARRRFIAKITGWPRIRFLADVFPDALFIEVRRDLRATASSLLQVPFWDGWRGPPGWRRGPLPDDLDRVWRDENRSFVALAAIECILIRRAVEACRSAVGAARVHEVHYAALCRNPVATFRHVAGFAGLGWPAEFERRLSRMRLEDRDDAWRARLTVEQQAILERTLERAESGAVP